MDGYGFKDIFLVKLRKKQIELKNFDFSNHFLIPFLLLLFPISLLLWSLGTELVCVSAGVSPICILSTSLPKYVIYHQSKRGQEQLFRGMSRGPLRNGAKRSGAGPRDIPRKSCSCPSFDWWYNILILVRGTGM